MRIFCDSRGFTLTELLVTMVISLIVLGTLYGFYRTQLHSLKSQESRTQILGDARAAMDMMTREIKNAGYWGTGTVATEATPSVDDPNADADTNCNRVYAATETSITIQADVQGATAGSAADGNCDDQDETITFTFNAGDGDITRDVGNGAENLAENVVLPGNLFNYYSEGSTTPLSFPVADLTTIKRVKVTFSVQVANPNPAVGGNLTRTLSSDTTLRN